MTRSNDYQELMKDPSFRKLLAIESLVTEAAELIARLMAEKKVNKAALAKRLNRSRAWITQLLSGKTNMSVRTLAELAYALEAEVKLDAQPAARANASRDVRLMRLPPGSKSRFVGHPEAIHVDG